MCDHHDHHDDAEIALLEAHQKRTEEYQRHAFKMPPPRTYEDGALVWLVDHYNTGRVVGPHRSEFTGATSVVNFDVEVTDADGEVSRLTYPTEHLRPATVEHAFRWTYTLRGYGPGRKVHVVSKPRQISGGYVATVAWADDDDTQKLSDGSVHPAHRAGFSWEEPILNIVGYHTPAEF